MNSSAAYTKTPAPTTYTPAQNGILWIVLCPRVSGKKCGPLLARRTLYRVAAVATASLAGSLLLVGGPTSGAAASGPSGPVRLGAPLPLYPTKTAGSQALVVMLSFADYPDTLSTGQVYSLYFGSQNSVASYFATQSQGVYTLTGQVISLAYNGPSTDFTAMSESSAEQTMIEDVVQYLDQNGFDWTPFENISGQVTKLILLRSVPPPNAASCTPWPSCAGFFWSFEASGLNIPTASGATITNADFVSQSDPVGTLDHEFGHLLGTMDTYDTYNSSCVVGRWDLYDQGNYNGSGLYPAAIDPYQRAYLGWVSPILISQNGSYTLPPAETSNQVDEIALPGSSTVYLLENVQPIGADAYLPGSGLLMWRIDTNVVDPAGPYWQQDLVNSTGPSGPGSPGISLVLGSSGQAQDTCGQPTDPFGAPGTYTGENLYMSTVGVEITNVQQVGQNVSFTITNTPFVTMTGPSTIDQGSTATFTTTYTQPDGSIGGSGLVSISTPWGESSAEMVNGTASFSVTPTSAASGPITATMPDGTSTETQISVSPSLLRLSGATDLVLGQANQFTVTESHADGVPGGSGTFSVTSPWGNLSGTMTGGVGSFSLTPTAATSGLLTLSLWDGASTQIQVSASAPALTLVGPQYLLVASTTTFTLREGVLGTPVAGTTSFSVSSPWGNPSGVLQNGVGSFQLTALTAGQGEVIVTLAGGATVSAQLTAAPFPYQDVATTSWAYPAVEALWAKGAFTAIPGWTGTDFGFATPITRAQFVWVLMQALGNTKSAPSPFTDVPATYWDAGAIGEAATLGWINGTGGQDFSPDATLTRAQMAAILVRAFAFQDNGLRFAFQDVPSTYWAYLDLNILWQQGVLTGTSQTTMSPSAAATRAEAVTMLWRASSAPAVTAVGRPR